MRRDQANAQGGIEIVDEIAEYLKSDDIHYNRYDHKTGLRSKGKEEWRKS